MQLVLGGVHLPLDVPQGGLVFLVEGGQLFLLALQGDLKAGHLLLLGLQLLPVRLGLGYVVLQLADDFLVPQGHGVDKLHAGGEVRQALGIQQDFQGAHVARGVQGHQPLFKQVDGVLHLCLGGLQL